MANYVHDHADIAPLVDKLRAVTAKYAGQDNMPGVIYGLLTGERKKSGTMKAWFEKRHGQSVNTLQLNFMGTWAPQDRVIDSHHGTFVNLGGSRRDFAGLRVIHADGDTLMVEGRNEVIFYTTKPVL